MSAVTAACSSPRTALSAASAALLLSPLPPLLLLLLLDLLGDAEAATSASWSVPLLLLSAVTA
jgi:hypothetical protein